MQFEDKKVRLSHNVQMMMWFVVMSFCGSELISKIVLGSLSKVEIVLLCAIGFVSGASTFYHYFCLNENSLLTRSFKLVFRRWMCHHIHPLRLMTDVEWNRLTEEDRNARAMIVALNPSMGFLVSIKLDGLPCRKCGWSRRNGNKH